MASRFSYVGHLATFNLWNLILTMVISTSSFANIISPPNLIHESTLPWIKSWYFPGTTHVMYLNDSDHTAYISYDEGTTFEKISKIQTRETLYLKKHPFDGQSAFVFGEQRTHWFTRDAGRSWTQFDLPGYYNLDPMSFHSDPGYSGHIIIKLSYCQPECAPGPGIFYTTNHFQSVSLLRENVSQCVFAHSSEHFKPAVSKEHIFCIAYNTRPDEDSWGVVESDTYFRTADMISKNSYLSLDKARFTMGAARISVLRSNIMIELRASALSPVPRRSVYFLISQDAVHWKLAECKPEVGWQTNLIYSEIVQSGYDDFAIMLTLPPPGYRFYMWNASEQHFQQTLNHVASSLRWVGAIQTPSGVDTIGFAEAYIYDPHNPHYRVSGSVATFDSGWTWMTLSVPEAYCDHTRLEPCRLYLDPYFMAYPLPISGSGQMIAVGCAGLRCNSLSSTWMTRDSGRSWRMISERPMLAAFGGGGAVIVMVEWPRYTRHMLVSLDHGETFREYPINLPPEAMLGASSITVQNSESLKFLLWARILETPSSRMYDKLVSIDVSLLESPEEKFGSGNTTNAQKVFGEK